VCKFITYTHTHTPVSKSSGKDVSRALAKMSFEPDDINSRVLSDLTPEQLKVLDDWDEKFENKKKYPVVGTLPPYE
jgi:membrane-associated progesterone receptor component